MTEQARANEQSEPECICGIDDNRIIPRVHLDIVCPKHDGNHRIAVADKGHRHERGRVKEVDGFGIRWFGCVDDTCYYYHSDSWWDGWEQRGEYEAGIKDAS